MSLGSQPNMVDPRGFLTFFISGIALLVLNWVAARASAFPERLAQLGYVLGLLLVVIYLGRLIVLDAGSPLLLIPAGVAAVVVSPLWYGWVGTLLLRDGAASAVAPSDGLAADG